MELSIEKRFSCSLVNRASLIPAMEDRETGGERPAFARCGGPPAIPRAPAVCAPARRTARGAGAGPACVLCVFMSCTHAVFETATCVVTAAVHASHKYHRPHRRSVRREASVVSGAVLLVVVAATLSGHDDADSLLAKPSALDAELKIAGTSASARADKGKVGDFLNSLKALGSSKQAQLFDTSSQDLDGLSAQEKVCFCDKHASSCLRVPLCPTSTAFSDPGSGSGSSALSN